jgi:hypothetical protein
MRITEAMRLPMLNRPRKVSNAMVTPLPPGFSDLYFGPPPKAISPRRASGGFNCVAQVSADMARRIFAAQVEAPQLAIPIPPEALREFIDEHREELSESTRRLSLDERASYFLRAEFGAPSDLSFLNPNRVHVTFEGEVRLTRTDAFAKPFRPAGAAHLQAAPFAALLSADQAPGLIDGADLQPADPEGSLVAGLGGVSLELTCDYSASREPRFVRCDVVASLSDAEVTLNIPSGDGRLFVESFGGEQATALLQQISAPPEVKLTPTISVVGHNPAGAIVREFSQCSTEVFHVEQTGLQALAIAFDLMPGCHGTVEDVQGFLCGRDFGVISDEWVVGQVLKNKWRLGGFSRRLHAEVGVRIKRGDREEDASVYVDVRLDGLDTGLLETDANRRTDFLRISGPATATPRFLRLQDGSVHGPDEVDLGEPVAQRWTVSTTPALDESPTSEWQMRVFQMEASRDAYRHLARPFANFPELGNDVTYTRVEGVEKFIYCLGNCREVFL